MDDKRECGWMGCSHPACARFCAGVPRDDFDYTTADVIPRRPDRHRGWFRRLRDQVFRPAQPTPPAHPRDHETGASA